MAEFWQCDHMRLIEMCQLLFGVPKRKTKTQNTNAMESEDELSMASKRRTAHLHDISASSTFPLLAATMRSASGLQSG